MNNQEIEKLENKYLNKLLAEKVAEEIKIKLDQYEQSRNRKAREQVFK